MLFNVLVLSCVSEQPAWFSITEVENTIFHHFDDWSSCNASNFIICKITKQILCKSQYFRIASSNTWIYNLTSNHWKPRYMWNRQWSQSHLVYSSNPPPLLPPVPINWERIIHFGRGLWQWPPPPQGILAIK